MQGLVAVVGRQKVIHPRLGHRAIPAQGAHLIHAHLTRRDHDGAIVDQRLQNRHRTIVEEEGVVVVGAAAEQFDIPGLGVGEAFGHAVDQAGGLLDADLEVVEGGIVVDIAAVADQTVIGDDLDPRCCGIFQRVRQGGAVNGRDDQNIHALGDHVLDLGKLVRDIVFGILKIGRIAGFGELLHHRLAVGNPAGRGFCRHGDADRALVLRNGRRAGKGCAQRETGQN